MKKSNSIYVCVGPDKTAKTGSTLAEAYQAYYNEIDETVYIHELQFYKAIPLEVKAKPIEIYEVEEIKEL